MRKKRKIRVAVLMGGKSPEHEISLISGKGVLKNLNPKKYEALPVVVSRDGRRWEISGRKLITSGGVLPLASPTAIPPGNNTGATLGLSSGRRPSVGPPGSRHPLAEAPASATFVDLVFLAMHGPYGEDGTVQGMLELAGVPYTGSGVLASALGMDKIASRKIWQQDDLPVVPFYIVRRKRELTRVVRKFGLPFVLKPADQGSSVGVSIVKSAKQFSQAWKEVSQFGGQVLAEPYIKGVEVSCGILGNENPVALPPVEIIPLADEFYSYRAKYEEGGSDHIIPPRLARRVNRRIQELSLAAFKSLGCLGFARVDLFVRRGRVLISEINTIPGLTPVSLVPQEAAAAGITYPQLLDTIIKLARQHYDRD